MYCFTESDIRDHWTQRSDSFSLSITTAKLNSQFAPFEFSEQKVEHIKAIIRAADAAKEFRQVVHGSLNVTLDPVTLVATAEVTPKPESP